MMPSPARHYPCYAHEWRKNAARFSRFWRKFTNPNAATAGEKRLDYQGNFSADRGPAAGR